MKYCCDPFYHALENAGQKGFAIIVSREHDNINYFIQSRICDHSFNEQFLAKMKSLPTPLGISIPLQIQKKIEYCPFCGKKLSTLMSISNHETLELIKHHNVYLG